MFVSHNGDDAVRNLPRLLQLTLQADKDVALALDLDCDQAVFGDGRQVDPAAPLDHD
jgi:hypothetical protein